MKQVVQPRRVLGDPQGNREQRRMAKKLDTKRSDGKERHDDPWSGQKVT
jgi:hypothetical protein